MALSPDAVARMQALRVELAQENAEHEPTFYIQVTAEQLADVAAGFVPGSVRAMARTLLDFEDADRRAAERPNRRPVKQARR